MEKEMQLIPYSIETATVENLKAKYMDVTIQPDDKAAYAMVMSGLRECREIRLAVDAWHKDKKAWIVKAGKHYDGERRRVHALVEPIETHLVNVRADEDNRKAAIEAEKERIERERVEVIRAKIAEMGKLAALLTGKTASELGEILDNLMDCEAPESEFMEFKPEADKVLESTIETVQKHLAARLKWEQEQAAAKAEAERLENIRREQAEAQRKLNEEKAKIEADKKALEDAKREEKERQDRAEFERKTRETLERTAEVAAKEKAEREAMEAAERAEKDRIEKERQEALRPDKDKINLYVTSLMKVPIPEVKEQSAKELLNAATTAMRKWAGKLMKQAQEM